VPGKHYYVDFRHLRYIVIDSNPLVRLVYLTRTLTWLREAMSTAGDRYVVVMMHHPVLSPAKGRFNAEIYAAFRRVLGEADLVLAGHDHSYMRRSPFVVLNTSGPLKQQRFHYTPEKTDTVQTYGVLSIADSAKFIVYRLSDGAALDSLYVKHH
jgi:3',5'-cyclic AMP phosphodiesterase CpdA